MLLGVTHRLIEEMEMEMDRDEALNELLRPIEWSWSSSIESRKRLVTERHKKVKTVLPFLSEEELSRARQWLVDESHSGLWD